MLHLQYFNHLSIPEDEIEHDIERLFRQIPIMGTPQERKALEELDGAKYIDRGTVLNKYGNKMGMEFISTSCKAILCILNRPDTWISTLECTIEACNLVFEICKDGKVVMEDKDVTYWTHTPVEIEFAGEIFESMWDFNEFMGN